MSDDSSRALRERLDGIVSTLWSRPDGTSIGWLQGEPRAALDEFIDEHRDDPDPAVREVVADALEERGSYYLHLSPPGAIPSFDELIGWYQGDSTVSGRRRLAKAMHDKVIAMWLIPGWQDENLALIDDLVRAFQGNDDQETRVVVASALDSKGIVFSDLGMFGDALAVYVRLLSDYRDDPDLGMREVVARGYLGEANMLDQLGRGDEAVASYNELTAHYRPEESADLRESVTVAFYRKAQVLVRLGQTQQAVEAYEQAITHSEVGFGTHRGIARSARDELDRIAGHQTPSPPPE